MPHLLFSYTNGNTEVKIFDDGTKVRTYEGIPAPDFPESMDVKITNWCDAGCHWCHEESTTKGQHANLAPTLDLIKQMPKGCEIAIGGGHPLSHPGFEDFVKELTLHGIICNVTINEKHFEKELPRIESLVGQGFLKGVGYSYKDKPCTWKYEHLVTHVIIGVTGPEELERILQVNNKVLLLGYKDYGRGKGFHTRKSEEVDRNIKAWYHIHALKEACIKARISMDNLAIEQLNPKRLYVRNPEAYNEAYMGEEGTFSMYMDAVREEYAVCSFDPYRRSYGASLSEMFKGVTRK